MKEGTGGNGEARTNPNLGEDALLLEGAGDERLELHHLPRVVVHPCLPTAACGWRRWRWRWRWRRSSSTSTQRPPPLPSPPLLSSLALRPEGETENGDRS
jgi:hypothetical protein